MCLMFFTQLFVCVLISLTAEDSENPTDNITFLKHFNQNLQSNNETCFFSLSSFGADCSLNTKLSINDLNFSCTQYMMCTLNP